MGQFETEVKQILVALMAKLLFAMKYSKNNEGQKVQIGKPVDDDFWEAFLSERNFLINCARAKTPDLTTEDCEDIVSEFALFYVEQASKEDGAGKRFEQLSRTNFCSRIDWKVKDFLRRRSAIRRGRGIIHVSTNDDDFTDWGVALTVEPAEVEYSEITEILLNALSEAEKSCEGKQLIVAQALIKWLEDGCPSESWTDFLSAEEVEEFMKLKKGVSLAGKASPAFCAVKQALKEIIESEGSVGDFSASVCETLV